MIDNVRSERVADGIGEWDRTWTTAICEGNRCVDYLVFCKENDFLEMTAISHEVIFSDNWVDRRDKKELC